MYNVHQTELFFSLIYIFGLFVPIYFINVPIAVFNGTHVA